MDAQFELFLRVPQRFIVLFYVHVGKKWFNFFLKPSFHTFLSPVFHVPHTHSPHFPPSPYSCPAHTPLIFLPPLTHVPHTPLIHVPHTLPSFSPLPLILFLPPRLRTLYKIYITHTYIYRESYLLQMVGEGNQIT